MCMAEAEGGGVVARAFLLGICTLMQSRRCDNPLLNSENVIVTR